MELCGFACAGWALVGVGVVLGMSSFLPEGWGLRRAWRPSIRG